MPLGPMPAGIVAITDWLVCRDDGHGVVVAAGDPGAGAGGPMTTPCGLRRCFGGAGSSPCVDQRDGKPSSFPAPWSAETRCTIHPGVVRQLHRGRRNNDAADHCADQIDLRPPPGFSGSGVGVTAVGADCYLR